MATAAARFDIATVAPVDKVQAITVDATGGTFTITYSGQTTSALAFNASGATITTALDALSNLAPGDIVVTGGPGDNGGTQPYVVTYGGALAGSATPTVTTTATLLTGSTHTAAVSTTTPGSARTAPTRLDTVTESALARGSELLIRNMGSDTVYIGGADVTSSNGFPIASGVTLAECIELTPIEALYAVTADGETATVAVFESGV